MNNNIHHETQPFQPKQLLVWFHEPRVSINDVIINMDLLPGAQEGDIAELQSIEGNSKMKLLFVLEKMDEDLSKKMYNVQISLLSGNLSTLLNIAPRSPVIIRPVSSLIFNSNSKLFLFIPFSYQKLINHHDHDSA